MKLVVAAIMVCAVTLNTFSQAGNFIKGKVVNGETGLAISKASVFITNTSKGTVSTDAGEFELNNVPEGTYDLVVSCIGFETQVYTYKASQLPLRIQVQMKAKQQLRLTC